MFDQILNMVKDQLDGNPEVAAAVPPEKADAVKREVATHINEGIKNGAVTEGGVGGLLSSLTGSLASGSPVTGAISGGLVASLGSKFGLPPLVTGAIAGALPGLLQKFANKANDPDDDSITPETINNSLSSKLSGLF